jgi:RNA polymerase sigma factor (sigma-70 family)
MRKDQFPSTQWNLVLLAGESCAEKSREALETLCRTYWYPLYAFVRRQGYGTEEAQDLTQAFFVRLLEKQYVRDYQKERGRFRSFLLASLQHFLANERDWARAQKRGGGASPLSLDALIGLGESRYSLEPRSDATPEKVFEKQWAIAVVDQVVGRLRAEAVQAGNSDQFDRFKSFLTADETRVPYRELAASLAVTEGSVKIAIYRLRRRFREVLREEIARTVTTPQDIQEEIRHLISVFGAPL